MKNNLNACIILSAQVLMSSFGMKQPDAIPEKPTPKATITSAYGEPNTLRMITKEGSENRA